MGVAYEITHDSENWQTETTHTEYIPGEVERMADELGLDELVVTSAGNLHQQAVNTSFVDQRDADQLASAFLFASIRANEVPITLAEFAGVSRVSEDRIRSTFKALTSDLGLGLKPVAPETIIQSVQDSLGLEDETVARLTDWAETLQESSLGNRSPQALAGIVLYVDALDRDADHSQEDLADAVGVSSRTIRNNYREAIETLDVEANQRKGMDSLDRRDSQPTTRADVRERLEASFELAPEVLDDTMEYLDLLTDSEVGEGKKIASLGAGAAYRAVRDHSAGVSQQALAEEMGVSRRTLAHRVEDLETLLED